MQIDLATHRLLEKFHIELVSKDDYWQLYENKLLQHDHQYLFIDFDRYLHEQYANKEKDGIYLFIKDGDKIVGIFYGVEKDKVTFEMVHSLIHPDYRGQGIYSALLSTIIEYTSQKGYAMIVSIHSPANNPILIAKLKKGFYLTAMEIDPRFGINAVLTYFHDISMEKAFKLRCGELYFDKTMQKYSHKSFSKLNEQIKSVSAD